jgi:predicted ATPase/class 3 adenylate cyclase
VQGFIQLLADNSSSFEVALPRPLPIGIVTFLFSDVEQSTAMHERDEHRAQVAIAQLDRIVADSVGARGGHVIVEKGEGDSHFCVFASPVDAVNAAIEIQRQVAAFDWHPEAVVKPRIGIHRGSAELVGTNYQGKAVIRCARLRSCAHGSQILISEAVMQEVRSGFEGQAVPLGRHWLRDLREPEDIFQVNPDGVHTTFPPLNSVQACPGCLPVYYSSFVGRDGEVAALQKIVLERQLVTATGAGGTGKTRLAIEVAKTVRPEFEAGVWLIPMADYKGRSEIVHGIAKSIGIPLVADNPEQSLFDWLRNKRILLILDNAEHMIDEVGRFVDSLLSFCDRPAILCTSRQPLGLNGEQEFLVRPLSVPPTSIGHRQAMQYEAYSMLVDRALDRDPTLAIDEADSAALCRIAKLLDGLPLAIELAAPRFRSCSPSELADRLEGGLSGLASQPRNDDARHRTIQAAIQWSYRLLGEAEQKLLSKLSCFAGGWTLDAAMEIAGAGTRDQEFQDAFDGLVEKSLVYSEYGPNGLRRFRLLELIRQFSREKHEASEDADQLALRHSRYFRERARSWHDLAQRHRPEQALQEFESDRENAHEGLRYAIQSDDQPLEFAYYLSRPWVLGGRYREGEKLIEMALSADRSSPAEIKAKTLQRLGSIYWHQGNVIEAEARYSQALDLFRELKALSEVAASVCNLGMTASALGRTDVAIKRMRLAYRLVRGSDPGRAQSIRYNLNGLLLEQRRYEEALGVCREMVKEFNATNAPEKAIAAMTTQAWVTGALGRPDEAIAIVADCLDRLHRYPNPTASAQLALTLAECALMQGRAEAAQTCIGLLQALQEVSGDHFSGLDLERQTALLEKVAPNVSSSDLSEMGLAELADQLASQCRLLSTSQ